MKFQNVVSLTYLIKKKPTNLKNNKPLIFQAIRPRYRRHFEDLGAFLALYKEYVENVHASISLIEKWKQKSPAFNIIVEEIEVRIKSLDLISSIKSI